MCFPGRGSTITKLAAAVGLAIGLSVLAADAGGGIRRHVPPARRCPGGCPPPYALLQMQSCEEVRAYLAEVLLEELAQGRYGWLVTSGPSGTGGGSSPPTDYSTTNNQEVGVDELDLVKTDGVNLFTAMNGWLRVTRSWPAAATTPIAAMQLDGSTYGLFLWGNQVAVITESWLPGPVGWWWQPTVRIDLVDVAQPCAPSRTRTIDIEGSFVGARLIDGHLYLVVSTSLQLPPELQSLMWRWDLGLPVTRWDSSDAERAAAAAVAREILRPYVTQAVAQLSLSELAPRLVDRSWRTGAVRDGALLACTDAYRSTKAWPFGVLSVVHLDLGAAQADAPVSASAVLGGGWTIYASSRSLYVAMSQPWWWIANGIPESVIHKFELAGGTDRPVRYVAAGQVPGYLLNQFSLSEHQGHLRAASTEWPWWGGRATDQRPANVVSVLRDDGLGSLVTVGQLGGIAPGEQIYASRFLGDRGFLVTFRQVDPLHALDLSDPTHPKQVGELVLPGFSRYLHPLGDTHLLAVSRAPEGSGGLNDLAISLFDVSEMTRPTLAHQLVVSPGFGGWSWSPAEWDHHAFTFHRNVLSIPAVAGDGWSFFSGLIVVAVDAVQGLRELGRVDHADMPWNFSTPLMQRSVYIEDYLYSLSDGGVKVSWLLQPAAVVARAPFSSPPVGCGPR